MDPEAARAVLGVRRAASRTEVRGAYREAMRTAHPDVAGPGGADRAAALNEAYAVLTGRAPGRGVPVPRRRPSSGPPATAPTSAAPVEPPVPAEVLDGDTVHLDAPLDEAFVRIVEACHVVGEVTYVDRSCPIVEALVRVPGEGACSLVVTLQGRNDGTEAFCTLEAIERVAQPPVGPVTAVLVAALRAGPGAPTPG